ncbi:MAG: hypothetical protein M1834_003577 [Cirrosporium novae-zelandiae]|nr:MAG: hypothetical protein M1834_003577 [Cirrosporium novae-zelandiae]
MPFHHRHPSSSTSQPEVSGGHGATVGIIQATHALGSIGAPSANIRGASAATTTNPSDILLYPGQTSIGPDAVSSSGRKSISSGSGQGLASTSDSSQHFEAPRRAQSYGRQPEELHIPPSNPSMNQDTSQQMSQYGQHPLQSTGANYGAAGPPGINLHQATPQSAHFSTQPSTSALPGALQPGIPTRPGPSSAATAPTTVPTLPQLSTQQPGLTSPSRSNTVNHAHGHSRSSPAGIDQQKYKAFHGTPETPKYSSPTHIYTPQTPHGASHSPLGLADIRQHVEHSYSDGPTSPNPFSLNNGDLNIPPNSNFMAQWPIYALDWCKNTSLSSNNSLGKIAFGSYLEDNHNFIQIVEAQLSPQPDPDSMSNGTPQHSVEFTRVTEATHSYPLTRILWEPPTSHKQKNEDLLATSGDHLRLWQIVDDHQAQTYGNTITRSLSTRDRPRKKLQPLALLSNSKSPEHTAPLTSLDWNTVQPSLIITSSIDTTCTIWDMPTLTAKTQLIAHDKEVFDVRFCANSTEVFASCGADGSVRMFDLRSLEHSTIIYEPSEKPDKGSGHSSPTTQQQTLTHAPPLLRLAASPHDAHMLATFSQDSNVIRVLDVRQPGQALLELRGHGANVNCIEWSPSRRGTLASGADDCQVLIWDLLTQSTSSAPAAGPNGMHSGQAASQAERGPIASWQCYYEVGNISWAPQTPLSRQSGDRLGVVGGRGLWGVSL